jgi:hypothetical protein
MWRVAVFLLWPPLAQVDPTGEPEKPQVFLARAVANPDTLSYALDVHNWVDL